MYRSAVVSSLCAALFASPLALHANVQLYVADATAGSVTAIDTTSNTVAGAPIAVGAHPRAPVTSVDGSRVYVQSGDDGAVAVIDTASAKVIAHIPVAQPPSGTPALLALSPDGRRLYVVPNGSRQITIIDTANDTAFAAVLGPADNLDPVQALLSRDGTRLYIGYQARRTIGVIDTTNGALLAQVQIPGPAGAGLSALALGPGNELYATGAEGTLFVLDATQVSLHAQYALGGVAHGMAVSPDGSHVYIGASRDECLATFDVATHVMSGTGVFANECGDVAISPDGHYVYVTDNVPGHSPGHVLTFDTATGFAATSFDGLASPTFSAQSIAPATIFPVTGLWWNPAESGRGFTIEVHGNSLVLIASVFDANGAATWLFAAGPYDPIAGTFQGTLDALGGGQCLGCYYRIPTYTQGAGGRIGLLFSSPTAATLFIDGGSIPIQKETW